MTKEFDYMKDYQSLIGKIIIAIAIVIAGILIAYAIKSGCSSIAKQIAHAAAISWILFL